MTIYWGRESEVLSMLSELEIKHYQDEGYVIPDYQLPHTVVEAMRE